MFVKHWESMSHIFLRQNLSILLIHIKFLSQWSPNYLLEIIKNLLHLSLSPHLILLITISITSIEVSLIGHEEMSITKFAKYVILEGIYSVAIHVI